MCVVLDALAVQSTDSNEYVGSYVLSGLCVACLRQCDYGQLDGVNTECMSPNAHIQIFDNQTH